MLEEMAARTTKIANGKIAKLAKNDKITMIANIARHATGNDEAEADDDARDSCMT